MKVEFEERQSGKVWHVTITWKDNSKEVISIVPDKMEIGVENFSVLFFKRGITQTISSTEARSYFKMKDALYSLSEVLQ